ncbi:Hypothetical protein PBC10988_29270 [Planctomycetales bacterium 10988]|nr:Hypothetical protein PBC10988_29270 [Planctomycetales bacterium 10988]
MEGQASGSLANDLVEEILGCLSQLEKLLSIYLGEPENTEAAIAARDLIETVEAVASMSSLHGLKQLAGMERELLEESLLGGPSEAASAAMLRWLEQMQAYFPTLDGGGSEQEFLREPILVYRRYRQLPQEEDEAALARIFAAWEEADVATYGNGFAANEMPEFTEEEAAAQARNVAVFETPQFDPNERGNIPEELLTVFFEEADEHLWTIQTVLPKLEAESEDLELVQEVRRAVHTFKGAAGAVGLMTIAQVSHRMEDLLDLVYDRVFNLDSETLRLLFASSDLLQDLAACEHSPQEIQSRIDHVFRRYSAKLAQASNQAEAPTDEIISSSEELPASEPTEASTFEQSETIESKEVEPVQPISPAPAKKAVKKLAAESDGPPIIDLPGLNLPSWSAPPRTKQRPQPPAKSNAARSNSPDGVLRVPLRRIDELVRLVSELILNRTGFEQQMGDFSQLDDALRLNVQRLRQVTITLEAQFEATLLKDPSAGASSRSAADGHPSTGAKLALAATRAEEFDLLEFDRYTEFHRLLRRLADISTELNGLSQQVRHRRSEFDGLLTRQTLLSRELQDKLIRVRMVPLETIVPRLERTVRTLAEQQSKEVRFLVSGEATELDKNVLEAMADPLMHLIRNAIDHGLEKTEERQQANKPAHATIELRAFYRGTQVILQLLDDGTGLSVERIRKKIIEKHFLSPEEAEQLSDEELWPYIFRPGFSTAERVSEVSGRGVGMDIVKTAIHRLKGSISIDSKTGEGTTFTIALPMTLAILRALLVEAGGQLFAIPMQEISQIMRIEREQLYHVGSAPLLRIGGKTQPVYWLTELLEQRLPDQEDLPSHLPVLLIRTEDRIIGLVVDRLLAGREIVVKTLGRHLRKIHGVMGATLLGDGRVVPILNPSEMIHSPKQRSTSGENLLNGQSSQDTPRLPQKQTPWHVLVVDDSASVRKVVTSVLKNAGCESTLAEDGLDALEVIGRMKELPDLILLDIEMPRMDGYTLLETLRQQQSAERLPIIMVTSRAGEKHRRKALQLGANDYIGKPFQTAELVQRIEQLADAAREARSR